MWKREDKQGVAWRAFDLIPIPRARRSGGSASPGAECDPPGRVGIFLQWGIGDAVLATPLLSALRRRYPVASLELIGKPWLGDLFAGTTWCDRTHHLVPPWTNYSGKYRVWRPEWRRFAAQLRTVRRESFDWLVGIRYDPREILQIRLLNAAYKVGFGGGGRRGLDLDLGVPPHVSSDAHFSRDATHAAAVLTGGQFEPRPVFRVAPEVSGRALDRLKELGYRGGLIVAVSWSAGHPIRRWDPSRFAAVLNRIPGHVGFLVMIAEPGELVPFDPPPHIPSARWQSSLSELKGLLSLTDLILATDSGVMHIASACDCRVVAIFGPQRPEWFGPYDLEDRAVFIEPMPCRPCFDACIYDRPICMLGVTADHVSPAMEETLGRLGRPKAEVFQAPAT
jgi:heptosyltransferase-2